MESKNILNDYFDRTREKINEKFRRNIKIINLLLALILVALSIISLLGYQFFKNVVTAQIQTYGFIGLFIAGAFLELVPQLLNPFIAILVGIGSGLNPDISIIIVMLGSIFGSVLGFELGNRYGENLVSALFSEQTTEKIFLFWKKHGRLVVFVSALTPVPYVPLVFGALKMKRKDLWIYGIVPRILSFAAVGYGYYFGLFQYNL